MALIKSIAGNEICDQTCRDTVNNISIGGRNYVLKSENLSGFKIENTTNATWSNQVFTRVGGSSGSNYGIYCDVDIPIAASDTTCLTVELTNVSGRINVGLCNTDQFTFPWGDAMTTIATDERCRLTTTWSTDLSRIRIYIASRDINSTCKLSKIKLEKGNKPTDYSPSPLDTFAMHDDGNGNITMSLL